jgi:hypothetical protein
MFGRRVLVNNRHSNRYMYPPDIMQNEDSLLRYILVDDVRSLYN